MRTFSNYVFTIFTKELSKLYDFPFLSDWRALSWLFVLISIDAVDSGNEKPVLLWAVYFNMESDVSTNLKKLPTNVRITSRPSAHLDFEDALVEVGDIYE